MAGAAWSGAIVSGSGAAGSEGAPRLDEMSLWEVERLLVDRTLRRFDGDVSRAAKVLRLSPGGCTGAWRSTACEGAASSCARPPVTGGNVGRRWAIVGTEVFVM